MANQLTEKLVLDSSNFDKNIGNVIKKVEELKNKGKGIGGGFNSSFGKMIEKATGFNGSMGSLVGVVGKFSGALGVAISAGEAFNKTIHSSQLLEDELGATQQTLNTVVDNFFRSLASADFSVFNNGIDTMIQRAREAYDEMDKLWNMMQSFGVRSSRQNNQFEKNLQFIRENKDRQDYATKMLVERAIKENEQIIRDQQGNAGKLYDQTMLSVRKKISSESNLSSDAIKDSWIIEITEADIARNGEEYRKQINKQYQVYDEERKKLEKYWAAKAATSKGGVDVNEKRRQFDALSRRYAKVITQNLILNQYSDDQLGKLNQQLIQGYSYESQSLAKRRQLMRVTKENKTTSTTPKSNRGGGGGSTEIDYAVNSVGWLEKEIQKLQKQIKLQVDDREIEKLQNKIKELQKQLDALLNHRHYLSINSDLSGMTPSFSTAKKFDEINNIQLSSEIKPKNLQEQYKHWTDIANNIFENYDIGAIASDRATELINEINKKLQSLGLKPIKLDIITDKEKLFVDIQEGANTLLNGFGAIDSVVSNITSLAEAIHQGADAWQIFMGVLETGVGIINSVATVLDTVNTLQELFGTTALSAASAQAAAGATEVATSQAVTTANATEAGTEAVKQGAKMPFPLNLVAIATSVAAVLAALAAVGAFANGGVVGGNSYSGDRLFARVNSGEAILNQNQQKHLFTLLDGNHGSGSVSGNVNFVIKGKDLHGCLANYDNQMSKVR